MSFPAPGSHGGRYKLQHCWAEAGKGSLDEFYPSELLKRKAQVLRTTGRWRETEDISQKSLDWGQRTGSDRVIACSLMDLAIIDRLRGDHSQARERLGEARHIFEGASDWENLSTVFTQLGNNLAETGQYQEALEQYQRSKAISGDLGDRKGVIIASGNIGEIRRRMGDYGQAQEILERAGRDAQSLGDKLLMSYILGNLGIVHRQLGEPAQAMECYRRKLELATAMGDKQSLANVQNNLGNLLLEAGQFQQAEAYFDSSRRLSRELGDKNNEAMALGNLGVTSFEQGADEQALRHFSRGLRLAEETGDRLLQSQIQGSLGLLHRRAKDQAEAERHYDRAIALCEQLGQKYYLAEWLFAKAELRFEGGRFEEAGSLNELASQAAGNFSRHDIKAQSAALAAKLQARTDKAGALESIERLLASHTSDKDQALLWHEHFRLTNSQGSRRRAAAFYRSLFARKPLYEYRLILRELECEPQEPRGQAGGPTTDNAI